jgi:hypothetical protein
LRIKEQETLLILHDDDDDDDEVFMFMDASINTRWSDVSSVFKPELSVHFRT